MLEGNLAEVSMDPKISYNAALYAWHKHPELGPKYGDSLETALDSDGIPTEVELSSLQRTAKDAFFAGYKNEHRRNWFWRNVWGGFTRVPREERAAYEACFEIGKKVRKIHDSTLNIFFGLALRGEGDLPRELLETLIPNYEACGVE